MADRTVVVRLIGDTSSYENAMRRAAGATGNLNTQGQRSIITLGNLGRLAGTYVAASVIKAGVSFESLKQTSQAAFTTMLGSASAARGELGKLYDFALHTPFAYPMILQAAQQMKAYGMETSKIIPTLHAVGDATAAMGGSADIFQRVVTAIGQIQAKGTVQAEEFRQLAEAGIPAWQMLANYLGTSVPEAMSRVEKRAVSSTQGIAALSTGIEQQFGGAMDALGNTWSRSVDRFTSAARRFGADVMAPIMTGAQAGMQGLVNLMNGLGPKLGTVFGTLGTVLTPLLGVLGSFLALIGRLPTGLLTAAIAMGVMRLASGLLNHAQMSMVTGTRTMISNWRVAGALANETGARFGRLGVRAELAGLSMRSAGRSAMAAFGGPVGLAIIAVTTALGIYSQRQAEAKEKAAEHRAAVDELTASLDTNTLALGANGRAEVESKLAKDKLNVSGKSSIETLRQLTLNASLYAAATAEGAKSPDFTATKQQMLALIQTQVQAKVSLDDLRSAGMDYASAAEYLIAPSKKATDGLADMAKYGDKTAQALLDLKQNKSIREVAELFGNLSGSAKDLAQSQKEAADAMSVRIPAAAKAVGDSTGKVQAAFDQWRAKGGDLSGALKGVGFNSTQVTSILGLLKVQTDNVADGFDAAGSAAATAAQQMRQSIGQGLAGFVSPVGAWTDLVQRKQQAMSGGGGSAAKTPKIGDDPAVKSITARIKAFKRQQDATAANLKAEVDSAKAWEKAEKKKADASQKAADATKKAADEAAAALTKAQDRKTKADQNAQDAANILAAVQHAALQAGTADSLSWASAVQKAADADTAAKSEQVAATQGLSTAQDNANTTAAKAKTATDANAIAQKNYKDAQDRATAASQHQQAVNDRLARRYQKMLDAKNKAEDKARANTEAMSQGGSDAVGGMVDNIKVSLKEYLDELSKQKRAQLDWKDNLIRIAGKVAPGVANALAALGPSAAPLVAELVHGTKAQLKEFSALFPSSTEAGVQGMTDQLTQSTSIVSQVAKVLGQKAATKLAEGLASGKIKLKDALFQLQGVVDKNSLDVKLGISNKKDMAKQLDNLFKGHVYKMIPWTGPGGVKGFQVGPVKGYRRGGWIKGGSGTEDDVPIGPDAWGMGGEFMVTKSIAQANKPFFDYLDRHGRMPQPVASPVSVSMPQPVNAGPRIVNHNTFNVVQQPGQDARGLVLEIDRLADLQAVR